MGLPPEISLCFPGGPNLVSHKPPYRWRREARENQEEAGRGMFSFILLPLKIEEYNKHKNMDRIQKIEKIRKWILP